MRREVAFAALRVTLGVLFLFAGVGKLVDGVGEFSLSLMERFAETWLPLALVSGTAHLLPLIEVVLGLLLVLGLFTVPALMGAAALIVVLTFGTTVEGAHYASGRNVVYAVSLFLLLWVADHDRYSLDRLRASRRPGPTSR